jgi:hypothetical protein
LTNWDAISPNNYPLLLSKLKCLEADKGLKISILGTLENGAEIHLIETKPRTATANSILIAAGFHGEESGGVWGIVHYLEETPADRLDSIHLSCIPVVNPTGFSIGLRQNIWGESPNSGFCHPQQGETGPSREGKILIEKTGSLVHRSKSLFISLHEDDEQTGYYLYTFEKSPHPSSFTKQLKSTLSHYFPPVPDGAYDGASVNDGLAFCHCDGSFEDYLFHNGVPRTACTETPASAKLSARVEANAALIESCVKLASFDLA